MKETTENPPQDAEPGPDLESLDPDFEPDVLVRRLFMEKLLSAVVLILLLGFSLQFWIFSRSEMWTIDDERDLGATLGISVVVAFVFGILLLLRWRNLRRELAWREKVDRQLNLLKAAVETMEIGITISDIRGRILYVNRAEAEMHGWEVEELIGKPARILAPTEIWKDLDLEDFIARGRSRRESLNIRSDGTVFPVQLISDVVTGVGGKPVGIVTSCEDISERKKGEEELHESRKRLRELASHLEKVRDTERSRIAHEIHNDLGAGLTVLKLDLSLLGVLLEEDPDDAVGKLHSMEENIDGMIDRIRRLSRQLRPFLLDDAGLGAALEWYAEDLIGRTGIPIELDLPEEDPPLDDETREILFRVFQEGVTNALRHAEPEIIRVELRAGPDRVEMTIVDNGRGYPGDPTLDSSTFGLLALKQRIETAGGTFDFSGNPGQGVHLGVSLPLKGMKS